MKKIINALIVAVILISVIFPTAISAKVTDETLGYKILAESQNKSELITVKDFSVIDRAEEPSIKARFLLIDAPEMQNKPYANDAKNRVRALIKRLTSSKSTMKGQPKISIKGT